MPNIVGRLALAEISRDIESMGSCVAVRFDKLTVQQASDLRRRFGAEGITARVIKNRWARLAFSENGFEWPKLTGKCCLAFAPEEGAITAAKLVKVFRKENRETSLEILAGIIEGEVLTGPDAEMIAEMPDKNTVRSMLASAISGPGRGLATAISQVGTGLARCLDQRAEGGGGD